jgi:cytochrome P450
MRDYARDPISFLTSAAQAYGDVFRLSPRSYFLSHPEHIARVLADPDSTFARTTKDRWQFRALVLFQQGMLNAEGESWRHQRASAQPAFHHDRVGRYVGAMVRHADAAQESWRDGAVLDVRTEMSHLALGIAGETLFGSNMGPVSAEVGEVLDALMDLAAKPYRLPRFIPTAANRRLRRAEHRLDEILYGMVHARLAAGETRDDLLGLMVSSAGGGPRAARTLRDQVGAILFAGHETTANSLSWALHLLATHPAAADRVAENVGSALGDRAPTPEDLPRMESVSRAVDEVLRLYPPIWVMSRYVARDCDLGGYRLPRGSRVAFSPYLVHRDPRFHADAGTFDPDRWADGQAPRLPKLAYFPCGGGQHHCLGRSFAMVEMAVVLSRLLARWRFLPISDSPPAMQTSITLRPVGLKLRVAARPPRSPSPSACR